MIPRIIAIIIFEFLGLGFAKAQIRIEGQIRLGGANQTQIEAAIEDAFKHGRIKSNSFVWEHARQELSERKLRKEDSLSFASIRENGYFYDRTNTKNYLIYISEIATFYIVTVVNCQLIPSQHNGNRCALGIITIRTPNFNHNQPLSRKERKEYLSKFYKYAIQGNRIVL